MDDAQRKPWRIHGGVVLVIGIFCLLGGAGEVLAQARPVPPPSLQEARELLRQANDLAEQGKHAEVIPLAEQALAIHERLLGPDHRALVHVLWRLGTAHQVRGDQGRAALRFARGLAITEQAHGPEHPLVATFRFSLAATYRAMGDDDRAVQMLVRALAIWKKAPGDHHVDVAHVLTQLGEVYISRKKYDQAEAVIQEALHVMKAAQATDHPYMSIILVIQASWLENARNDHRAAIPILRRALAIQENAPRPDRGWSMLVRYALGQRYYSLGEYAMAEAYFMDTFAFWQAQAEQSHPGMIKVMRKLMQTSWARGDTARAVDWLSRLQEARAAELDRALEVQSEEAMTHYLSEIDREADQALQLALERGDARTTRLAWTMLLGRKGRVLQVMSSTLATLRSRGDTGEQALLDAFRDLHTRFANEVMGSPGDDSEARRRELLDERYALDKQLRVRSRELAPLPPAPTIEAIQAALPRDAIFVDWVRYRPFDPTARDKRYGPWRYAACVLAAHGQPACVDLGDADKTDRMITALREAIINHMDTTTRHARALHARLLAPLRAHIGDAEHLFLAPDAALHLVPFAALVDERGRFLVERFTITHLLDGSELLRPAAAAPPRSTSLVMAAPAFGAPHPRLTRSFPFIPGLAREGGKVRDLLGADLLTGEQATEDRLQAVRGPKVLHLATHGTTDWQGCATRPFDWRQLEQQLRPWSQADKIEAYVERYIRIGVALAGANTCPLRGATTADQAPDAQRNDGWLGAPELSTLDLHGTRLVVLSACETGEGLSNRDAGFFGLRRALVMAGAETHMVSLWSVDDRATEKLMATYYRKLVHGAGRSEALRETQRALLREDPTLRQRPFYWAGFIVSGNPAPL